jgi:hypothetical protein
MTTNLSPTETSQHAKTMAKSPSHSRRGRLQADLTVPSVSNFFALKNYYEAADKVYKQFQESLQRTAADEKARSISLDDAYVYGKRYCTFVTVEIPKHNYYKTPQCSAQRTLHHKQVDQVLTQLEEVVVRKMDEEEEARALHEAAERARQEQEQCEAIKQRFQRQFSTPTVTTTTSTNVEVSALNKLSLLRDASLSNGQATKPTNGLDQSIRRDPSGEERTRTGSSTRFKFTLDEEDSDAEANQLPPPLLPPPLLPPPESGTSEPPPYDVAAQRHRHFLGIQVPENDKLPPPPSYSQIQPPEQPLKKAERIPMSKLKEIYGARFDEYRKRGRIQVGTIRTYQGRTYDSTNGCTVISALVAARHLESTKWSSSSSSSAIPSITDDQVCRVIDGDCGPLLREIRSKLGLSGGALIIPSDVHDHLVDKKILKQEYFVGAAGGNIMDPAHLGEFVRLLSRGEESASSSNGDMAWNRKAAATLFFREHVVSIVRCPLSPTKVCYDLVDSLPSSNGQATRTRCDSVDSLLVLLQWYTSRKFTAENCHYIDRTPWDDMMADFDPRVFQGFVWAVPPAQ